MVSRHINKVHDIHIDTTPLHNPDTNELFDLTSEVLGQDPQCSGWLVSGKLANIV